MTPNLSEIRAWTANQIRTRREYEAAPITTGRHVPAPCVRCHVRTARTHRGVCRACLAEENR